ncbi:MAG TPA: TylF/MycF/NovP-related O-methyltransferase [Solirubrobacterales bacterium]
MTSPPQRTRAALRRLRRRRTLAQRVSADNLTYLSPEKLANLEACMGEVNRGRVPGDVHETGIALGGSAIVLAGTMGRRRRFHGYDVFAQIPPPSERDGGDAHSRYRTIAAGGSTGIGGDTYYGYVPDLHEEVCRNFARYGLRVDGERIALHRGLFEETLEPARPVALAHIDCDWHDPVMLCLERLYPWLSVGGYLVLDDYNDYSGSHTAANAFLAAHNDLEVVDDNSNLVVRRTA